MHQISEYVVKAIDKLNIFLGIFATVVNYVLFPDIAYTAAAVALGGAVLVDIFSKYVVITKRNGGFLNAFRRGKIFSKTLWIGTKVKLQAYLSISIMVGLSYRLNSLPGAFTKVSVFIATVVYTVLFLREFQSILENFRDAGVEDLDWLLTWAKSREREILKEQGGISDIVKSEEVKEVTEGDIDEARSGYKDVDDIDKMI